MPEPSEWTHTESPFIAAADGEAMYWTGATIDSKPSVLYIERAITADHAFVTVAEVADPDDPEAIFAAAEYAPQICVPLSVLAYLGQYFAAGQHPLDALEAEVSRLQRKTRTAAADGDADRARRLPDDLHRAQRAWDELTVPD
jgi:hypothetical protein